MKYDVVVIGSGSAGGVLAARLSEDAGRRVLLVEAGPDRLTFAGPSTLWNFTSADGGFLPRGKILGGCSATNAAIALRGAASDYDSWGEGWTFQEVMPSFLKIENDLDFGTEPWHSNTGPVTIRRKPVGELTELSAAFVKAAMSAGHPDAGDHNRPGSAGVGPAPMNELAGVHQSTAVTYLAHARGRPNLTIRCDTLVHRLVVTNGRVTGIVVQDGLIEAETVIVSAGAYGSPAILLRSGIGPAQELAALDIPVVADLPVGRGLQDHALVSVGLSTLDSSLEARFEALVTFASSGSAIPDLQLFVGGAPSGQDPLIAGAAVMKPRSRGRLWLRSTDPAESPNIDLGLLTDPRDAEKLNEAIAELQRVIAAPPFAALIAHPGDLDPRKLAEAVSTYHHPTGTCAMGSVVDARCAVQGVQGLWVVDASVMPEIPAANTNLPTMMIAERFADITDLW